MIRLRIQTLAAKRGKSECVRANQIKMGFGVLLFGRCQSVRVKYVSTNARGYIYKNFRYFVF